MSVQREKFSTQMDAQLLSDLRRIAKQEGRQLQSLIEEAVERLVNVKDALRPNAEVINKAQAAMAKYSETLKYLAK